MVSITALSSLLVLLLPAALAAPTARHSHHSEAKDEINAQYDAWSSGLKNCDISSLIIPLPSNQTQLVAPQGQVPEFIFASRGEQNYTCTDGAFVSVGALADLFDVSCVLNQTGSVTAAGIVSTVLPIFAFNSMTFPDSLLIADAHHQFIPTPGSNVPGAISPEFFINATDKVVGVKNGTLNAPNPERDVTWLELTAAPGQGDLAQTVFRINTVGGQPPASCNEDGELLSVPYSAEYWFFGPGQQQ